MLIILALLVLIFIVVYLARFIFITSFVIDRNMSAVESIRASTDIMRQPMAYLEMCGHLCSGLTFNNAYRKDSVFLYRAGFMANGNHHCSTHTCRALFSLELGGKCKHRIYLSHTARRACEPTGPQNPDTIEDGHRKCKLNKVI